MIVVSNIQIQIAFSREKKMAPFTKESLLLFVVLGVAFVSLGRTAQSSPDQQNLTREKKYRRKFFSSRQVISSRKL